MLRSCQIETLVYMWALKTLVEDSIQNADILMERLGWQEGGRS